MMILAAELAALFERDLARLGQQIESFPDDQALWIKLAGVQNSAGNLVLHLEGNLREYIGRQLGNAPYQRYRGREFSETGLSRADLRERVAMLRQTIPGVIRGLTDSELSRAFPEIVFSRALSTAQYLIHLHGHFNYHLGQIDYLRRIATGGGPLDRAAQL